MGKLLDKIRGLRKPARPFCATVVVAAGQSRRMGKDKLLLPLGDASTVVFSSDILQVLFTGGEAPCLDVVVDRSRVAKFSNLFCLDETGVNAQEKILPKAGPMLPAWVKITTSAKTM